MIELLQRYGFRPAGSCRCNGVYTLKFKRGQDKAKYRPHRFKARIIDQTQWLTYDEMEKHLQAQSKEQAA